MIFPISTIIQIDLKEDLGTIDNLTSRETFYAGYNSSLQDQKSHRYKPFPCTNGRNS